MISSAIGDIYGWAVTSPRIRIPYSLRKRIMANVRPAAPPSAWTADVLGPLCPQRCFARLQLCRRTHLRRRLAIRSLGMGGPQVLAIHGHARGVARNRRGPVGPVVNERSDSCRPSLAAADASAH